MPRCIVQECPHYSGRKNSTPGVTFHMFPKNLATIKIWLQQINQNFGDADVFAQGVLEGKAGVIRICSAHFATDCYQFVGSQKILLENAIPTIFPTVKAEDSPDVCTASSTEKQEVAIKMESSIHPMTFFKKEKPAIKVESTVQPMMFDGNKKTAVKGEATKPPKSWLNKGVPLAQKVPEMKMSATSGEGVAPLTYWNVQPLQMSFYPAQLANPLWANNGLSITNLNPWLANTLTKDGANVSQKHTIDISTPMVEATQVETHVENVVRTDNVLDMQDEESLDPLPNATSGDDCVANCPDSLLSSTIQQEDKAVQWPEHETTELAWKVHHDHYYKVRKVLDRSAQKNGIESAYQDMESEEELLATLKLVTGILWKNRRKRNLKTARILNQTLEIISLVTGEEWVIVKKDSIHKGIHELTGEVPVKCENVAVFFTLDEWSYVEKHKQQYAETVEDNGPVRRTWQVQEHWDSEEEYFSEEEEEEVEASPKRKSSPEWKPGCYSSAEEGEENDDMNPPITPENGEEEDFEFEMSQPAGEEDNNDCNDTSMENVVRHKSSSHPIKRYPCPICGIQYDYKSQFIIHQRAHTGEKPFVCQVCGAKFGHKSSYLVHERRHTEGKTFECEKCERRFDKKCELLKHEKTHNQKKRHKCRKCGKRYASRSALMRHKWAHKDK